MISQLLLYIRHMLLSKDRKLLPRSSEEVNRPDLRKRRGVARRGDVRRPRSSYPAHEYGRNDRFTDSSHRPLPRGDS